MIVAGTGDEFAGLQVAERPDTSRNSDVDYLSVRPWYPRPLCPALAMPRLRSLAAAGQVSAHNCTVTSQVHLPAGRMFASSVDTQRSVPVALCFAAMPALGGVAAAHPPAFPQELLAMQQNGPKNIGFFGTRNMGFSHQKLIEVLSYAMVLTVRTLTANDRKTQSAGCCAYSDKRLTAKPAACAVPVFSRAVMDSALGSHAWRRVYVAASATSLAAMPILTTPQAPFGQSERSTAPRRSYTQGSALRVTVQHGNPAPGVV